MTSKLLNIVIFIYYIFQEEDEVEKHLDMPPSWVKPIILSLQGEGEQDLIRRLDHF